MFTSNTRIIDLTVGELESILEKYIPNLGQPPAQSIEEMQDFYNQKHPSLDDKCGDFESEPSGFNSITDYEVKLK